jgi:hypothetical protein
MEELWGRFSLRILLLLKIFATDNLGFLMLRSSIKASTCRKIPLGFETDEILPLTLAVTPSARKEQNTSTDQFD